MGTLSVQLDHPGFAAMPREHQLRVACNEFIGSVMFGQMLKQARESTLNSDLFNSRAQQIFQSQLDDVLLQQAAAGPRGGGMFGELGEALYRSLGGRSAPAPLDVEG